MEEWREERHGLAPEEPVPERARGATNEGKQKEKTRESGEQREQPKQNNKGRDRAQSELDAEWRGSSTAKGAAKVQV